jgi:hypothetical protein
MHNLQVGLKVPGILENPMTKADKPEGYAESNATRKSLHAKNVLLQVEFVMAIAA